jgi:photosystem II stability/assembly factor-like uncharacterized protein
MEDTTSSSFVRRFMRTCRRALTVSGISLLLLLLTTGGAAQATARHALIPTSISFWSARAGLAAFVDGSTCSGPAYSCEEAIAVTNDGGRSWTTTWRGRFVRSVSVVRGTRHAWAAIEPLGTCGARSPAPCRARLLHSSDGGRTWQARARNLVEPAFATEDIGFAIRSRPGDVEMGPIMRTADGGRTWRRIGGPCVGATRTFLSFVSARHGWLLCKSQPGAGNQPKAVFETRDGGKRWHLVADALFTQTGRNRGGLSVGGYAYGMSFEPSGDGLLWQARGDTYATSDGGRHWRPLRLTTPEPDGVGGSVVSPDVRFLLLHHSSTGPYDLVRLLPSGRAHVVRRWRR